MPGKDLNRWQENDDGTWSRRLLEYTSTDVEEGIKATASAVQLAEQLGIDLSTLEGSGKDGKITKPDVEAVAIKEE